MCVCSQNTEMLDNKIMMMCIAIKLTLYRWNRLFDIFKNICMHIYLYVHTHMCT